MADTRDLPDGRPRAGDRHLKIYDERDNLIGYAVSFTLKSPKRTVSALFAWAIFGAGDAEEVLRVTSTLATPMPAGAVTMALGHLEGRLIAYAVS